MENTDSIKLSKNLPRVFVFPTMDNEIRIIFSPIGQLEGVRVRVRVSVWNRQRYDSSQSCDMFRLLAKKQLPSGMFRTTYDYISLMMRELGSREWNDKLSVLHLWCSSKMVLFVWAFVIVELSGCIFVLVWWFLFTSLLNFCLHFWFNVFVLLSVPLTLFFVWEIFRWISRSGMVK